MPPISDTASARNRFHPLDPPGIAVAIGLGSNLGDRRAHLELAARRLRALLQDARFSPIYQTEPVGPVAQGPFLNACCVGGAVLTAPDLLARLKSVERMAGRPRGGPRFGPRVLDLDILLFGREIVRTRDLTVPHARLDRRAFALVPLSDIAAEWVHPVLGATIGELCRVAGGEGVTRTPWRLGADAARAEDRGAGTWRGGEDDVSDG